MIGFSFSFFWLVTGSRVTTSECEESGCTVSHNASEEVAAQISADEASAQVSALGDAAQLRSIKMHSDSSVKLAAVAAMLPLRTIVEETSSLISSVTVSKSRPAESTSAMFQIRTFSGGAGVVTYIAIAGSIVAFFCACLILAHRVSSEESSEEKALEYEHLHTIGGSLVQGGFQYCGTDFEFLRRSYYRKTQTDSNQGPEGEKTLEIYYFDYGEAGEQGKKGWWIGDHRGSHQTHGFNPADTMVPPVDGWRFPPVGPEDFTFKILVCQPCAQTRKFSPLNIKQTCPECQAQFVTEEIQPRDHWYCSVACLEKGQTKLVMQSSLLEQASQDG